MKYDEIRWGSIGCGNVMEVKSGPALQSVKHSQLFAVMRRDASLAKDFALRHHVPIWCDQVAELIENPAINAIYIATPPDSHLEYTRLAAQAGKVVYVEKPMANSYAQCLEMIDVCKQHKAPLFVAYYRRALPRFLKVKSILDSGQLGIIQDVRVKLLQKAKHTDIAGASNWRVQPDIAGCGYFCDLGSHIFDLLQFLIGDILFASGKVNNTGGYYPAEDIVEADFTFKNGVKGSGVWDFNADRDLDRTEIIGSEGKLSYTHFAEADVTLNTQAGEMQFEIPNPLHIQQPLIQLMIDELRGIGNCPSTGASAAETNRIIDQILGRL